MNYNYIMSMGTVILSIVVAIVVMNVMYLYIKANTLIIRDPTKINAYLKIVKVVDQKDNKTGVVYWKSVWFSFMGIRTPEPPTKAINVTTRGKKVAEGYQLSSDEFVWITDDGLKEDSILEESGKRFVDTFKPFSVVQRDTVVNQHIKSTEIETKGRWTPDKIIAITNVSALTIIVICLIIFYQDIAKPALESHQLALQVQKQNIEILQAIGMGQSVPQAVESMKQNTIKTNGENAPIQK